MEQLPYSHGYLALIGIWRRQQLPSICLDKLRPRLKLPVDAISPGTATPSSPWSYKWSSSIVFPQSWFLQEFPDLSSKHGLPTSTSQLLCAVSVYMSHFPNGTYSSNHDRGVFAGYVYNPKEARMRKALREQSRGVRNPSVAPARWNKHVLTMNRQSLISPVVSTIFINVELNNPVIQNTMHRSFTQKVFCVVWVRVCVGSSLSFQRSNCPRVKDLLLFF